MNKITGKLRVAAIGTLIAVLLLACAGAAKDAPDTVVLATELGDIVIEVYTARAPHSARSFLDFVDAGEMCPGVWPNPIPDDRRGDEVSLDEVEWIGI